MLYYRFRKNEKRYLAYPEPAVCPFCNPDELKDRVIRETTHCLILPNRTQYDIWELRKVTEHLLLIPKRHVHNLQQLTSAERADIMDLIAEYESNDYNVHARGVSSVSRSVRHQHTHLFKTDAKHAKGVFFWRRPYILWLFR